MENDKILTPTEVRTMKFLREFICENGYSPTYRQISKGINKLKFHPSEINRIIYQLKNKNLIDNKKAKNCSIWLVNDDPRHELRP